MRRCGESSVFHNVCDPLLDSGCSAPRSTLDGVSILLLGNQDERTLDVTGVSRRPASPGTPVRSTDIASKPTRAGALYG